MVSSLLKFFAFTSTSQLQISDEFMECVLCLLNPGLIFLVASLSHGFLFFDQAGQKFYLKFTVIKYIKYFVFKQFLFDACFSRKIIDDELRQMVLTELMDHHVAEYSFKNIVIPSVKFCDNKYLLLSIEISTKETFDSISVF